MNAEERALLLTCAGERLLAVLTLPDLAAPTRDTGVAIVVGGPQVRMGSHRQFVQLARALARQGWPVLRFDVRGMGDSSGAQRSFDQLSDDIGAAVDGLCMHAGVRRVTLLGLCDGASAALLFLSERTDPRVTGLCLLNPWVRSDESLARTHVKHYYAQRLAQKEFWLKLLRGGVGAQALRALLRNLHRARSVATPASGGRFQDRMAQAWQRFGGRTLLVLSGNDFVAREFVEHAAAHPVWSGLPRADLTRLSLDRADHTLSDSADRTALEQGVLDWLAAAP